MWNGRHFALKNNTTNPSIFVTGIPCTNNDFPNLLWMLYVSVSSPYVFPSGFQKCELISGHFGGEWKGLKYVFVWYIMSEKSDEPLPSDNMPQKVAGKPNAFSFVLNLNISG